MTNPAADLNPDMLKHLDTASLETLSNATFDDELEIGNREGFNDQDANMIDMLEAMNPTLTRS